jgi:hypothetical protein
VPPPHYCRRASYLPPAATTVASEGEHHAHIFVSARPVT